MKVNIAYNKAQTFKDDLVKKMDDYKVQEKYNAMVKQVTDAIKVRQIRLILKAPADLQFASL